MRGIRRHDLVGGSASLVGWTLEFQKTKPVPVLPVDLDVELSAPSLEPCLPARHDASHHGNNGLNL